MNSNNIIDEKSGVLPAPSKPVYRYVELVNRRDSAPLLSSSSLGHDSVVHSKKSFPSYESKCVAFPTRTTRSDSALNNSGTALENIRDRDANERSMPIWSSRIPTLRPVGYYHVVSQNSSTVHTHELSAVLDRLQAAFQAASCQCSYKHDQVHCRTLEETEFVVSLWLKDNAVLIEMDRVAGDSIVFYTRYVPLIMQAIRGTPSTKTVTPDPIMHEHTTKEMEAMHASLFRVVTTKLPSEFAGKMMSHVENALDLVGNMLISDRYDLSNLGLESLALMTDPSKSSRDAAAMVSRIVLIGSASTGESVSHRNRSIQQYIYSLALTGYFWQGNINTTIDAGIDDPAMAQQLAYKALRVLAHAVSLASTEDMTGFVQAAEQLPGVHSVVDRLLEHVHDAQNSPHSAYLATHILAILAHHSIESDRINVNTIQQAQFVGTCSHAALAQASRRLLAELAATS